VSRDAGEGTNTVGLQLPEKRGGAKVPIVDGGSKGREEVDDGLMSKAQD